MKEYCCEDQVALELLILLHQPLGYWVTGVSY